jgi:hypothetical protein
MDSVFDLPAEVLETLNRFRLLKKELARGSFGNFDRKIKDESMIS